MLNRSESHIPIGRRRKNWISVLVCSLSQVHLIQSVRVLQWQRHCSFQIDSGLGRTPAHQGLRICWLLAPLVLGLYYSLRPKVCLGQTKVPFPCQQDLVHNLFLFISMSCWRPCPADLGSGSGLALISNQFWACEAMWNFPHDPSPHLSLPVSQSQVSFLCFLSSPLAAKSQRKHEWMWIMAGIRGLSSMSSGRSHPRTMQNCSGSQHLAFMCLESKKEKTSQDF